LSTVDGGCRQFLLPRVVDKGGETCDQGGVGRQSEGKHVTRAGLSTEGSAWFPMFHFKNSSIQAISYDSMHFACLFSFICHCRAGLVGRVVGVAVIVVEHR